MTKLPSYFEYMKEHEKEPNSMFDFSYDHSIYAFNIANAQISLADFDPYTFSTHDTDVDEGDSLLVDALLHKRLVLPSYGGLIAGPTLHEWIGENSGTVQRETPKVMYEAFISMVKEPQEISDGSFGHMGFDTRVSETGSLILQVFGNCACMGVNQHGGMIQGIEEGFAQYDLHNADSQVQRASLYAGIGHLAFVAKGAAPAQGRFF